MFDLTFESEASQTHHDHDTWNRDAESSDFLITVSIHGLIFGLWLTVFLMIACSHGFPKIS
jgi:hypothetical protein